MTSFDRLKLKKVKTKNEKNSTMRQLSNRAVITARAGKFNFHVERLTRSNLVSISKLPHIRFWNFFFKNFVFGCLSSVENSNFYHFKCLTYVA